MPVRCLPSSEYIPTPMMMMMNSAFAPLWGLQTQCFSFRNYPLLRLQQGANPATLSTAINLVHIIFELQFFGAIT